MTRPITLAALGWLGAALALMACAAPALAAEAAARKAAILAPTTDFSKPERWEELPGGTATNRARLDRDAFSQPSANLDFKGKSDFSIGNGLFRRVWVAAPASTKSADGLGPIYNARACQNCHLKDGRGHPPAHDGDSAVSMFLRLSVPPRTEEENLLIESGRAAVIPEPTYGGQLQDLAVAGVAPEGRMAIAYEDLPVALAGGETVTLRKPAYRFADPAYGRPRKDMMVSPRVAPAMIGLGLLEAISEADILAKEDPDDDDGDGISARANRVWSAKAGRVMLGRFGWKAGMPNVDEQSAGAMAGDIGISNPLAPAPWGDCAEAQAACRNAPHGATTGELEASAEIMAKIAFYSRNLAVPARRGTDNPNILHGKELFYGAGCIACHTPKHATSRRYTIKALGGELIWPYTDLLLHDMGEGLADDRPEGGADGREWRTAPLWGIGLTETVNGHTFFLHDGRGRSLTEAILWHGGEAQAARDRFVNLDKSERDAVIAFLNSL